MNFTPAESERYLRELLPLLADATDREVLFFPSYTSLPIVQSLLDGTGLVWGAQDISEHDRGAHTGEVSGRMLAELGCSYVMVGHLERRRDHGETNVVIRGKVDAALRWDLTPVLCVGDRERGPSSSAFAQIRSQLEVLQGRDLSRLVVAYEPLWAIGQQVPAKPDLVAATCTMIHAWARANGLGSSGEGARVVYGGGINPDAAPNLLRQQGIDGLFVGSKSLIPADFSRIVHVALQPRDEPW
jgi:triosephosphate isomerase